ncbi:MAG: T9SS type A sorting domain-containing protein [Flavobacteriales bacterium]|nr:T9SS type A sorting domain-containing protein [Flavobacteriales bacterium]
MKKLYLCLITCMPMIIYGQNQQINNSNFELWQNLGQNTEKPNDWNSFMNASGSFAGFAAQQIRRSTVTRPGSTGQYSAVIWSRNALGTNANGNMTTGRINMGSTTPSSSSNYNYTQRSNSTFYETMTDLPDSIICWVKFKPVNVSGTDSARMRAVVHGDYDFRDPSDAGSQAQIVRHATRNFRGPHNQWQRLSVPFIASGPATTPYYILVTFTTNKTPGGGSYNDSLWIDDVSLVYNPTLATGVINPTTYYVTPTAGTAISVPFTATGTYNPGNVFTAQLSDASGSFANPIVLGTLTGTTSGTINGIIPAGTPTGTGYRVRVVSSNYPVTGSNNGTNLTINLVTTSIAPASAQTIEAGVNGTALTVAESVIPSSREWKYSTISGGPYTSFVPAQTGSSYVPNFSTAGAYYVVCESSYPGLTAISNEVLINVVDNTITPASPQSILIGVNGTTLTVSETPAGTSREWKYSTTSGGPYNSFVPAQTGTTYTPNFSSAGTYYVVCQSVINGITVTSNEVVISVNNLTLSTGTISGSPFEFSASAPNASVSVPYTVGGTGSFNVGNVFTAQLSDAFGSFASPVNIGSITSTNSGVISATIPSSTPAGTGYRIRVVASSPAILGSDNGSNLVVDQFNNSITPPGPQTFVFSGSGTTLTVNESQNTIAREWRYASTPGGPYSSFVPAQTGVQYTPSFPSVGTYYVVCASTNQYNDEVISNEVICNVTNSITLTTTTVTGAPFYVSPSANVTGTVSFTTDVIYGTGNVFTAELSDLNGSFATPVSIGSLSGTASGTINITIPNNTPSGNAYRIRVVSSNPPLTGTPNTSNLSVVNFEVNASPTDTQNIVVNTPGTMITATSSHPGVSYEWKYKTFPTNPWSSFSPSETSSSYTPLFTNTGGFYVACMVVNTWNDTLYTDQTVILVSNSPGSVEEHGLSQVFGYFQQDQLVINLSSLALQPLQITLFNMAGQQLAMHQTLGGTIFNFPVMLPAGIYHLRIDATEGIRNLKIIKQ